MPSPGIQILNFTHPRLQIAHFSSEAHSWCFYGKNDSGLDILVDLFSHKIEGYSADELKLPQQPAVVSFKTQQEFFEEELRNDESDFLDRYDPGTLVKDLLAQGDETLEKLTEVFKLTPCLDLGYRQLSSGQARKALLLQAMASKPDSLILENPLDGLDEKSCRELTEALAQLEKHGIGLYIFINNISDIPTWCENIAIIENNQLNRYGQKDSIISGSISRTMISPVSAPLPTFGTVPPALKDWQKQELISLKQGFAVYGKTPLFSGLDLRVMTGEHTLICGPNGCGKSTLLDIITGDNPKCYANDLRIFGRKRGSGESIWDLKKGMGIISPALHREHRVPGTALHIVLSGLHDSIGLYSRPQNSEIRTAKRWLDWLGLTELTDTPFRRLSFARQRLILIGRGLIKAPKLLILDEPTQGLDQENRKKLLDTLEKIAEERLSTILFVSHRKDEYRSFFTSRIHLNDYCS